MRQEQSDVLTPDRHAGKFLVGERIVGVAAQHTADAPSLHRASARHEWICIDVIFSVAGAVHSPVDKYWMAPRAERFPGVRQQPNPCRAYLRSNRSDAWRHRVRRRRHRELRTCRPHAPRHLEENSVRLLSPTLCMTSFLLKVVVFHPGRTAQRSDFNGRPACHDRDPWRQDHPDTTGIAVLHRARSHAGMPRKRCRSSACHRTRDVPHSCRQDRLKGSSTLRLPPIVLRSDSE